MDNTAGLGFLDLVLLIGSILSSVIIGLYFTNKNKSLNSYMRADGGLSVVPVAISLMTSCMSGLSLLGSSAELYYQGPTYALVAVAMMLSGPATAFSVLPVFYRMNELSLYKYLEKRFGFVVKYLVTIIFIGQMIFYNAVVMYLPSMALQSILGIKKFYSILFIGLMCVVYSGIGGIKAVVWTDFFQAALMYASIIIVGALGTYDAGGFAEVFRLAKEGHRLDIEQSFFEFDLTTRHTLFGILVGSTVKHIYLIGVNQVQIQRALSLASLRKAQYAFVLCSVFTVLISLFSTYMGFVVYSSYRSCDPYLANEIPRRDALILHYIDKRLSRVPGIKGIFVAGIFSGTLSTLSSFANSMSALALEDFIGPIRSLMKQQELTDSAKTLLAKGMTMLFGLLCVLMAFAIDKSNSRLLQTSTTMFGAIGVPFLACFALGLFTRFTNTAGVLVGLLVTLTLGTYVTVYQTFFSPPLEPAMPIYYNEQCALVFNMTMSPDSLLPMSPSNSTTPAAKVAFQLDQISYMTLPAIQFVLTIVVATLVSLATGGLNQKVDEKYLVTMLHRKEKSDVAYAANMASYLEDGFEPSLGDQKVAGQERRRGKKLQK